MEFTVSDTVYGSVSLPAFIRPVVEVTEFKRLNHLKQLGVARDARFSGAQHTRYQHSLGACYLANRLLDALSLTHPVSEFDRKCVLLAALLHDVGHGPYSHMWEKFVEVYGEHWKHEESSVRIVDGILRRSTDLSEQEIALVCGLIRGDAFGLLSPDRRFLSQIVSGDVDVDRCDYLQRDSQHVPDIISPSRPFRTIFDRARVMQLGNESILAYDLRDYALIYEMACARQTFHIRCYQDPKVLAAEHMMLDVLHEAERVGFQFSRNGMSERLSNVHKNLDLFKYLDDSIVDEIACSQLPGLEKAKELINRLRDRKLYQEILPSPVDLSDEVEEFNRTHGEPLVRQTFRNIRSTKQWFEKFNVNFYACNSTGNEMVIVPVASAGEIAAVIGNCEMLPTSAEVKDYVLYCTSDDVEVQRASKHHFTNVLNAKIAS
ncbi:deoxynucleoside triphosphate triphosphohydrolase SAMHD1 homolog [Anopheles albimanus]|uniref:HD domain-containing protein n=1 Tax=Anopheles albimanus TaxID=7167 RepID=A0A182FD44_ANOAL|nr:deoxynucleoside triphosphate triphosphohydrolase SAMHD1 homolog [Anopheles albimanus]XP_035784728.1 deoxynucleoside triphosphate triphosphohydrolase SAMHD1 homolog [Anopheles albimanus]